MMVTIGNTTKPWTAWAAEFAVRAPVCPSRGYESAYREQKMAAHTTVGGRGTVARIRKEQGR